MDSAVYQEIIRAFCRPFVDKHMPEAYLQQDNAPCYTSKSTKKFFEDNRSKFLPHHLGIQDFWKTVTPEKCRRYIGHLKTVIPKVIEVGGESTDY